MCFIVNVHNVRILRTKLPYVKCTEWKALRYLNKLIVSVVPSCCNLRRPSGERIVDVVPGGTELELRFRRKVGQAAHAHYNPRVKGTGVYCS